jgi:hypothetical protein
MAETGNLLYTTAQYIKRYELTSKLFNYIALQYRDWEDPDVLASLRLIEVYYRGTVSGNRGNEDCINAMLEILDKCTTT